MRTTSRAYPRGARHVALSSDDGGTQQLCFQSFLCPFYIAFISIFSPLNHSHLFLTLLSCFHHIFCIPHSLTPWAYFFFSLPIRVSWVSFSSAVSWILPCKAVYIHIHTNWTPRHLSVTACTYSHKLNTEAPVSNGCFIQTAIQVSDKLLFRAFIRQKHCVRIHQGLRCWGRGEGSGSLPDRLSLSLFITAADVLAVHSLQSCLHMLIMSAKNSPGNFSWRWKNDRLPHWPFKTSHTPSFFLPSVLVSFSVSLSPDSLSQTFSFFL